MDQMDLQERKIFLTQVETHLEQNELRAVLNLAEERLKRTPGDLDARIAICRVWLLQGRLDEAREMLGEMEEILSSLSRIYACMGDICSKKGLKESAEDFYRKFAFLNPGVPPAMDVAERLSNIEDRHDACAEPEAEVPQDFQTVTLAELYIRQGHLQQAEELLDKIVGQDPQNEKAIGLLRELREPPREGTSGNPYAGVIAELSRWLSHIDRLRAHAA